MCLKCTKTRLGNTLGSLYAPGPLVAMGPTSKRKDGMGTGRYLLIRRVRKGREGPILIKGRREWEGPSSKAVSYTHLTLPTKRIV